MITPSNNPDQQRPGQPAAPVAAASVLLFRGNEVLLVQRASGDNAGLWSAPGGHLRPGETAIEAAHRELLEETGVQARTLVRFTTHEVRLPPPPHPVQRIYEIAVFIGLAAPDTMPRAASDAAQARFFSPSELLKLPLTTGLAAIVSKARIALPAISTPL